MRKRALRLTLGAVAGLGAVALFPTIAHAQEEPDPVVVLGQSINLLWVVIGAILVIFMQAGFALVETGFCRAKHAAHVVSTNFAIFGLGFIAFFFVGFPLAFGGFSTSLIGLDSPVGRPLIGSGSWVFLYQGGWALSSGTITPALMGFFLYMVAFMDTVATIPTGSMAERWKWGSFVIWGLFCGAIYYPLFAAWTWGGGWLSQTWDTMSLGAGYVDFAGSGVVHAVGGAAALAGAIVLGARKGKFADDGTPRAIPGHHIPMAMLGTADHRRHPRRQHGRHGQAQRHRHERQARLGRREPEDALQVQRGEEVDPEHAERPDHHRAEPAAERRRAEHPQRDHGVRAARLDRQEDRAGHCGDRE